MVLGRVREDGSDINLVRLAFLDCGSELGAVLEGLVTNVNLVLGGRLGVEEGGLGGITLEGEEGRGRARELDNKTHLNGETPLPLSKEVPLITNLRPLLPVISVAEPIVHHLEGEKPLVVHAEQLRGEDHRILRSCSSSRLGSNHSGSRLGIFYLHIVSNVR